MGYITVLKAISLQSVSRPLPNPIGFNDHSAKTLTAWEQHQRASFVHTFAFRCSNDRVCTKTRGNNTTFVQQQNNENV